MANAADLTRELKNELVFTSEELKELGRARTMPITFGEECPETTPGEGHEIPPGQPGTACGELIIDPQSDPHGERSGWRQWSG